ncbi:PTS sugar transporter subunit IIA [Acholeplasma granularum]|uniref:PTS sugar transporter subunit IIA n=1 Tax=Acholeplasma granularum TaxID=264635 RepID=UPI000470A1A7|nr:PTS sugar transporter subunit IIA [Acholeplasma granularum]
MNLFKIEHVITNLKVENKDQLFDYISTKFKSLERITSSADFKKALEKRESEITTGLGDGLAIPHALHTSVLFPSLLYIRLEEPLAYNSLDDKPVKEVYAIAMPNSFQKEHLVLLSKIANIYLDEEKKLKLNESENIENIFKIIEESLK